MTLLDILIRYSANKREKRHAFICVNIQVINTILKVNRDNRQTLMRLYNRLSVHYIQYSKIDFQLNNRN